MVKYFNKNNELLFEIDNYNSKDGEKKFFDFLDVHHNTKILSITFFTDSENNHTVLKMPLSFENFKNFSFVLDI